SQLFGDNVDVGLREDHGEASQVNVAESRSVNHELRLLESQIKLKEAEAKAKEVGIRQAEAEAKAKKAEAIAKEVGIRQAEADSKNLRLRIQLGHKVEFCCTRLQPNTGKPAMIVTAEANTSPVGGMAGMSKADSMPIALVSTKGEARESAVSVLASRDFDLFQESFVKDPDLGTFRPFLSQGTVEVDGVETPVTILRDSGCLQTLIKEGIANVACMHELPVAGVDLIFGNDLAGGQIGNVTPPPVLRERPESTAELQQLEDDMPGVFRLCAETRSMSMTNDHNVTPDVDD
ncbi:hypothetical protein Hamer_G031343, partial [Homarus americanus]